MKICSYKNYEEYVEWQTKTNKIKLNWVYAKKHAIDKICADKKEAKFIICHGTRNGKEMQMFLDNFPDCYIIGTEISNTANSFPHTIQHDFTFPKNEWIGKADIVYSNSLDHTIDPHKTIQTWRDQLNPTGTLYIEYNEGQSVGNLSDPLDATLQEIEGIIIKNNLNIIKKFIGSQGSAVLVCERKQND
jgi:hypothetical protein